MDQSKKDQIGREAADILLATKSVNFNALEPFTYTSGKKGPVYIDVRRLMSFPAERSKLMDMGAQLLRDNAGDLDYVAGGETAGIPYAAFIAERMNLPMLYVRKKPKGHGRMAQIEGYIAQDNPKIAVIEDLQNRGGSKQIFIDALREAGATVKHAFVVFDYGIYPKDPNEDVIVHSLSNWRYVLDAAKETGDFTAENLAGVEAFLNDPEGWSAP